MPSKYGFTLHDFLNENDRAHAEQLHDQMTTILDGVQARGEGGSMLASERNKFDAIERAYNALTADAEVEYERAVQTRESVAKAENYTRNVERIDAERHARITVRDREMGVTGNVERSKNEYARVGGRYLPEKGNSFIRDLCLSRSGDFQAAQRLTDDAALTSNRALSTTAGAAGEFAPPLWLVDQFVALARPGRVTADLMTHQDLPPGTDVINVPKVATGTVVAQQTSQNTAISQVDMTTSSISSPVYTFSGGQVVSVQLIEQSPIDIDRVVLSDLAADYARAIDLAVITGTGTGQLAGLQSSAVSVPYTTTTPTSQGVIETIAQAIAQVSNTRFMPATAILMTPLRWGSLTTAMDSTGRPLVVPDGPAFNGFGSQSAVAASGRVGTLLGLPVYVDPQIPSNLGTGTNQDEIFVLRQDDVWFWESSLRLGAFEQTYASQLSWLVRAYNYAAIGTRHAASVAVVNGTGMTPPVFGK